jgi:flavin-dependent dehydrogenase
MAMDWPYPVAYGKENEVDAEVLVLGGGVAGSHAAISAAKRGARVVVLDKGAVIRSGDGAALDMAEHLERLSDRLMEMEKIYRQRFSLERGAPATNKTHVI